ncbi:hypothetical protein HBI56_201580 [Parastagonospora nodorum]|uniref:Uncharacterized protein n=2 Tax=Phaeosphaeria nodorum (strain SN15 / ATCC MYA-4574 / FGSC 10173) TaxID=321614 RepID=A0A7U2EWB2_PHANO|nr:hypothetical protein SNOG_15594 [Parastagonospora nodorum SN15]KAH3905633.1 hypothetical protein HBH56_216110 [Parastagonospora nodorum]EAT76969.1 hypothetical protein SNOG_15594 [Parastagonospora nodorum SN15]KAH3922593.1 hypothetical protein HBH54_221400 [Parastagonospora nodorum]KAH3942195.1 hypothetical protein HBH53_191310 [Parastagonospora nodorum]KAH3961341.1 hypothetical protein HBH51_184790 [Parastagonospora nodorum]
MPPLWFLREFEARDQRRRSKTPSLPKVPKRPQSSHTSASSRPATASTRPTTSSTSDNLNHTAASEQVNNTDDGKSRGCDRDRTFSGFIDRERIAQDAVDGKRGLKGVFERWFGKIKRD